MTMTTYPADRTVHGNYAVVCIDPKGTIPAAIFDLNGAPIPKSTIRPANGIWPEFQYSGTGMLYYRATDGTVDHFLPAGFSNPTVITGSRGGATVAVLTSVLAALSAQGVIIDQTTA